MINRGGDKVYPAEVEQVIASHPAVAEVAVAGVPDRRLGSTPHAWIVPVDADDPPSPDDLFAHTREQLAGYKVPASGTSPTSCLGTRRERCLRRMLVQPEGADRLGR